MAESTEQGLRGLLVTDSTFLLRSAQERGREGSFGDFGAVDTQTCFAVLAAWAGVSEEEKRRDFCYWRLFDRWVDRAGTASIPNGVQYGMYLVCSKTFWEGGDYAYAKAWFSL